MKVPLTEGHWVAAGENETEPHRYEKASYTVMLRV